MDLTKTSPLSGTSHLGTCQEGASITADQMEPEQEAHLARLQDAWGEMFAAKYRKGARNHRRRPIGERESNHLLKKTPLELVDEALQENMDQFSYLMTLRDKLSK